MHYAPDPSVKDGHATRDSYLWGTLAGFAYVYMVAAWGGFVFVVNMVGAHAAALFFLCRYTSKLHRAYSLFYVIGTLGAMRVPVVGWSPLKSTEQLAPLLVFFALQILEYVEVQRRKRQLSMVQVFLLRVKVTLPLILGAASVAFFLQTRYNYFGPPSARVRGLFVKHTRTGNPLVDSVAEHQPANAQAYQQYLHNVYDIAPYGFLLSFFRWSDANAFLILYAVIAYYFSSKMARLVILLGPVASVLGGVLLGMGADRCSSIRLASSSPPFCRHRSCRMTTMTTTTTTTTRRATTTPMARGERAARAARGRPRSYASSSRACTTSAVSQSSSTTSASCAYCASRWASTGTSVRRACQGLLQVHA